MDGEPQKQTHSVRLVAHLLLIGASILYVIAIRMQEAPLKDLLLAFSEAALVGGLADWFAVTALFRRPLGLPFPHTAIIPSNKDRIGKNFGLFMERNFLSPDILERKLLKVDFSSAIFGWISQEKNATEIVQKGIAILRPVLETVSDDGIYKVLLRGIRKAVQDVQVTPYIGRSLQFIFNGDRSRMVTDELFRTIGQLVEENKLVIRKRVREKSPWFIPDFIDSSIYEKIVVELKSFFGDVITDAQHPFREKFAQKMIEFAKKLETDASYRELGEAIKQELLSSENLKEVLSGALKDFKIAVSDKLVKDNDPLVRTLSELLSDVADEIYKSEKLRDNCNEWIRAGILSMNNQYSAKVAQFITDTVRTWDTSTIVDKFELEIGRDLQFIRVNGTLVGGFIGVIIYLIKVYAG